MSDKEKIQIVVASLRAPERRLRLNAALDFGAWALVACGCASLLAAVFARTTEIPSFEAAALALLALPVALFLARLAAGRKDVLAAARAVDAARGLDDRLYSSLCGGGKAYMKSLVADDAARAASSADVRGAVGVEPPEKLKLGLASAFLAVVVLFVIPFDSPRARATESLRVLADYKLDKMEAAGSAAAAKKEDEAWVRLKAGELRKDIKASAGAPEELIRKLEEAYAKLMDAKNIQAPVRDEMEKGLRDLYAGVKEKMKAEGRVDGAGGKSTVFEKGAEGAVPAARTEGAALSGEFLSAVKRYPRHRELLSRYFSVNKGEGL